MLPSADCSHLYLGTWHLTVSEISYRRQLSVTTRTIAWPPATLCYITYNCTLCSNHYYLFMSKFGPDITNVIIIHKVTGINYLFMSKFGPDITNVIIIHKVTGIITYCQENDKWSKMTRAWRNAPNQDLVGGWVPMNYDILLRIQMWPRVLDHGCTYSVSAFLAFFDEVTMFAAKKKTRWLWNT